MAGRNDRPGPGVPDDRHSGAPDGEGGTPSAEELTGRASKTGDNLRALFDNDSPEHLADGFRGGSDDDQDVGARKDDDLTSGEESGTAV